MTIHATASDVNSAMTMPTKAAIDPRPTMSRSLRVARRRVPSTSESSTNGESTAVLDASLVSSGFDALSGWAAP